MCDRRISSPRSRNKSASLDDDRQMVRLRPDLTAVDCAAPSDFRRSASKSTHDRTRSDRSENCLVRSRGRSLSRHQRLALTFLRLPSPVHQGRIEARAGRGTSQFDLEKKSVSTFPGLEAIADPKFPLKNVSELCEVASGASPSERARTVVNLESRLTIF